MSTQFSFKAKLKVGDTIIPLASEIVVSDKDAQDGMKNGFLFKLDLGPNTQPPAIDLGAIIGFIEQKLGAGDGNLQNNRGMATIRKAFPTSVSAKFDSNNSVVVVVRGFVVNSTKDQFLFSISVDVKGTDPTKGFIPLPSELAGWLAIEQLAISFSASKTTQPPPQQDQARMARGNARASRATPHSVDREEKLEKALKLMKQGATEKAAAKAVGVSAETLRRFQKQNTTSRRDGHRWVIIDERPVTVAMAPRGDLHAGLLTATDVDLKLGLNLKIGSLPVSLDAEIDEKADRTVTTFDGCVQDADIELGKFLSYAGQQFGVDVELPPELNLEAKIDYIAGKLIHMKPKSGNATTELGVAGKFDLIADHHCVPLRFYVDTIINSPAPASGNPYVVGVSLDHDLKFADLPLVGRIPDFNAFTLTNVGFSYTNVDPSADQTFSIPQVTQEKNPLYTRKDLEARNSKTYSISSDGQTFALQKKGFSLTAGLTKAGATVSNFALPMALPAASTPGAQPASFSSQKTTPPADPVHWIDINETFGPVSLKKIGLNYSSGEATFGFSAGFSVAAFSLDLQGLTITFPLPLPGQPAGTTASFDLSGLAFGVSRGGLTLGGHFSRSRTARPRAITARSSHRSRALASRPWAAIRRSMAASRHRSSCTPTSMCHSAARRSSLSLALLVGSASTARSSCRPWTRSPATSCCRRTRRSRATPQATRLQPSCRS